MHLPCIGSNTQGMQSDGSTQSAHELHMVPVNTKRRHRETLFGPRSFLHQGSGYLTVSSTNSS